MLEYKVTKQFEDGAESTVGNFTARDLAEKLILEKLADDAKFNVKTTYYLYDDLDNQIRKYTKDDLPQETSASSSDQGKRFSPTPFNTKPQPGGLPHSWVKDDEDNKEK